jgi:hypothetical protein
MWKRRRTWLLLLAVVGLTLAFLYESMTHVGRGWLCGEAFYHGRPTSYWADEIQQWEFQPCGQEVTAIDYMFNPYARQSPWPYWVNRFILMQEPNWPLLFDGDPEGVGVLRELLVHPSEDVRDWARRALDRVDSDDPRDRGPCKKVPID